MFSVGIFVIVSFQSMCLTLLMLSSAHAATYVVSPKGNVVGELHYTRVVGAETLLDIARRYDVGINAIKSANPGIDAWVPGEGTKIRIPTRHILPTGPREGIVINLPEMRLYQYVTPPKGPALVTTYPISIGREGLGTPLGRHKIVKRIRKPTWTVPEGVKQEWRAEGRTVRDRIPPGPDNPLGEYAMTLSAPGYLIHGTNKPFSIGMRVSRGCVRLYPEDIEILVQRTATETSVRIIEESFKYGEDDGLFYMEIHKPEEARGVLDPVALVNKVSTILPERMWSDDWARLRQIATEALGVAMPVRRSAPSVAKGSGWVLQLGAFKNIDKAQALVRKVELLNVPVALADCNLNDGICKVQVGPFVSGTYLNEVKKRIKEVVKLTPIVLPYHGTKRELSAAPQVAIAADEDV